MKRLQHHLLAKCDTPAALWIIFILTIMESIFLFIPPEVYMTPTIVANKKKAVPVVLVTALGSLVGGILAYLIGMFLFATVGSWIIETFLSWEMFEHAQYLFAKHGLFIIFLAAFTPVPYKLLTIVAGFLAFNPLLYFAGTAVFRTMRFAVLGAIIWRFQEQANYMVKRFFWPLAILGILAAGFGVILMKFI